MQFLIALLLSAVAAFQYSSSLRRSDPLLVRAVIDGDTIDVATYGRVRLLGIDAPEIGRGFDTSAPFGREARDRLAGLVLRRWVRLEQEGPALDAYDRHLAYVITETGELVNATLVREGLARVSARLPLKRLDELKRAEAEAQAWRRGMWGETPQIGPAGYTRWSHATRLPAAPRKKATTRKVRKGTKKKRGRTDPC